MNTGKRTALMLVMDERESVRSELARALEEEGFLVAPAERGYLAASEINGNSIRVVISDSVAPSSWARHLLGADGVIRINVPLAARPGHWLRGELRSGLCLNR